MKPSSPAALLAVYARQVESTDRLPFDDLQPVLLGLFGEVGSIMATAKKFHREGKAYAGYRDAVEEEFGDTLWYFAALCRRLKVELGRFLTGLVEQECQTDSIGTPLTAPDLDTILLRLGEATTALFVVRSSATNAGPAIAAFGDAYVRALKTSRLGFEDVVRKNVVKTTSRFLRPDTASLPTFDDRFPPEEQLPRHFEITIDQRNGKRSYLRWHSIFIGDPLTDNILDRDGYRFHDVFHFAHAAVLHWSPTFRALIKQKRKSDPVIDEAQDGGRAIVVEEGLTAWIFARAKDLNYFAGQKSLSFDLLKTVRQFVSGYEVEACPLSLWEMAILQGYEVFRQVRDNNGGIVVGDRTTRSIEYLPLDGRGAS